MMGHPRLRPGGTVSGQTDSQQRYPLGHITTFASDPTAIDGSLRAPVRQTLLDRHRDQLVCLLLQGCAVFAE